MTSESIRVLPEALTEAATALISVAGEVRGVRGSFSVEQRATAACDPIAAGAYEQMQHALSQSMTVLELDVGRLGLGTGQAAVAYVTTDRAAVPTAGQGDGT